MKNRPRREKREGSEKAEERKGAIQAKERPERESSPTTLGFSHRDHPEFAGVRAPRENVTDEENSEHPCSNPSVAALVVARPNLNGLMSLLTRTERSVSFQIFFPPLNLRPYRTTSAIVSMPPPAGGRKIKTFIGTIAIKIYQKKSVRKKSVKSRRQRQRHSPLRCMPCSLFILPFLDIHSHTQWFWTIKEGTIVEYTRHGHKCDTHPSNGSE